MGDKFVFDEVKKINLGDIIEQIRGVSYKPDDLHNSLDDDSVILLRANNIRDGKINFDDVAYVDRKKVPDAQYLQKGDILICASSGSKDLVGKAASFDCDVICTFGAFCKVVRPKEKGNYIAEFFQSNFYRRNISNVALGANINNIRNEHIDELKISLYPTDVEKKFVSTMQLLDKVIIGRRQQLEEIDILIKARFIEMFGDPISNPMEWDMIPLGKRCDIITGNTPPRADSENYGEYIEWIKSDNINTPSTYITEAEECLSEKGFAICRFVESGSLLMTCIAGSVNCIGNVAVTNRRVAFNQQINAIVPTIDEVLYLYWLIQLSKPAIHSTINKALKGILSKGQLSEMRFPFPPVELQQQFAGFVQATDKSKSVIQKSLNELQTLFDSLMQEYFG